MLYLLNMSNTEKKLLVALVIGTGLIFAACKKPPGPGGKATIKGRIYAKDFNTAAYGPPIAEYYSAGETVYICYGTDQTAGNSVKTGTDGSFEFLYLRAGHYKVFATSRDTSIHVAGANKVDPVSVEVDITSNRQVFDVGTLTINK